MAPLHLCLHETLFFILFGQNEKQNKQQHYLKYLLHVKIYVERSYGTLTHIKNSLYTLTQEVEEMVGYSKT